MENYNNDLKARNDCVNHLVCITLSKNHFNPVVFVIIIVVIGSLQLRKLGPREVNKTYMFEFVWGVVLSDC